MKAIMLNKIKYLPENLKGLMGLLGLSIVIFFTFFILNIFYGPDPDAQKKAVEQKKIEAKANEFIETLPRGVLTVYKSEK